MTSSDATLQVMPGAGEIDEDLPHQLGTHCKEVSAILPTDLAEVDQP
jgi:hypothetical protein